jgi:hemolysin activation/secretion protein
VQAVTNYYRNSGYILSRAILPPQHVANGEVVILVIEGYIDKVRVIGAPHGAKKFIQRIGEEISKQRPLKLTTMEHYLLLANNVPGVQVKAVLEPSKSNIGASDLDLVTQTKVASSYMSYDNYGTRYIGPNEVSLGTELESIFLPGDSTQFNATRTTRGEELKFYQGTYNMPVGVNGARLLFSGNNSRTLPGFILTPAKINGDATTLYSQYQYPVIRSRAQNLTADASFNYIDSKVVTFDQGFLLYNDHLRTLRAGLTYDMSDSYFGANNAVAHVEQGLEILGATPEKESQSGFTSRYGGSGHFTKLEMQYSRLQQFGPTRFAAYFIVKGQYALEPLLATEQFGYGGVQQALGRGYDPAEIIGDRGLAGSIEFRLNASPGRMFLQAAQLFIFYDAGAIWNMKNVPDQPRKQSATSAGFGSRFYFTQHFSGNLLWAQPLTRPVSSLVTLGDERQPRIFFSVTATM